MEASVLSRLMIYICTQDLARHSLYIFIVQYFITSALSGCGEEGSFLSTTNQSYSAHSVHTPTDGRGRSNLVIHPQMEIGKMPHLPYIIPYTFLTACGAMPGFPSASHPLPCSPFLPISLLSTQKALTFRIL